MRLIVRIGHIRILTVVLETSLKERLMRGKLFKCKLFPPREPPSHARSSVMVTIRVRSIENSSHANACAIQNQNTDNCASTFIACAACFICVSRAIDVESVLFVVDGNWSPWSGWSGCGAGLCGGNKKVRTRSCTNPQPTGGGKKCAGNSFEEASCPGNVKKVIRQKMHTVFFRKTVNICVSVCFHVFVHEEIKVIFKRKVLKHDDNLLP